VAAHFWFYCSGKIEPRLYRRITGNANDSQLILLAIEDPGAGAPES